jgi:two-component system cell cycle sensor histidine kinase/response regulator CckA
VTDTRRTILLAEDEPGVRLVLAEALERAGYAVHQARIGEEAAAIFAAHGDSIDLLLTDLRMPLMGGADLVRQLRVAAPGLKVICVSGYPGAGTDPAVTRHFLAKPFSRAELLDKVREVLEETG